MKRFIALVSALLMVFAALPAVAEDAMPREVQTFFSGMGDVVDMSQVAYAADQEAYVNGMPGRLLSFTISRQQYDSFYYYVFDEQTAITVCCVDGKPLAYILDCAAINFIGGHETTHNILQELPGAYSSACPQQVSDLDAYAFFTSPMLSSIYDPMAQVFLSDVQDHGQTLVSSHIFALGGQMAVQLFPKAAYDGLIVNGEALTPEINHDLSAALAMDTEYQLVMKSLEQNSSK
ncbi:MAG: hypothetical protein IJ350_06275 [Clostridia bacterium]|nr:hypothetical protein [Clostridia bacterium]